MAERAPGGGRGGGGGGAVIGAADDRTKLRCRLEQFGRLVTDDLQVTLFVDIGVVAIHQLQHFAFGDDVSGVGKNLHDAHVADIYHHLERARVEKIPHQNTGSVAEQRIGSFPPTPQVGLIDDVIVQQGRRMDKLDNRRQLMVPRSLIAQGARAQEHQGRTQTLAAGTNDVLGHLPDEHHVGMQPLTDHRIDGLHVRSDQVVELFQLHGVGPDKKTRQS